MQARAWCARWARVLVLVLVLGLAGSAAARAAAAEAAAEQPGARAVLASGAGFEQPDGSRAVRWLQRRLARDGFDPGPVDGLFGPLTEAAVIRFQRAHGLTADGRVGTDTTNELANDSPGGPGTAAGGEVSGRQPASRPATADGGLTERAGGSTAADADSDGIAWAVAALMAVLAAGFAGGLLARTGRALVAAPPGLTATARGPRPARGPLLALSLQGSLFGRGRTRLLIADERRDPSWVELDRIETITPKHASADHDADTQDQEAHRHDHGRRGPERSRAHSPRAPHANGQPAAPGGADATPGAASNGPTQPPAARAPAGATRVPAEPAAEAPRGATRVPAEPPPAEAPRGATRVPAEPPPAGAPRGATRVPAEPAERRAPRAFGYVAGNGAPDSRALRAQAEQLEAAATERGFTLVGLAREAEPANGRRHDRPALDYALRQLVADRADLLLVARLEQLCRSVAELAATTTQLEQHDTRLVCLEPPIDSGTETGRTALTAITAISAWERERLAERTRKGLAAARTTRAQTRPTVADRPELKQRILAMRANGMTLQAIADQLNEENVPTLRGGREWRPSSVQAAVGYKRPNASDT